MTTQAHELLPCPFCGAPKAMMFEPTCRKETPYNPADRLFPVVRCMACYAEVAGANEDYRGQTAIAAWNRRSPIPEPAKQEPVAWMVRGEASNGNRVYTHDTEHGANSVADDWRNAGWTVSVQPLYASAPSAPVAEVAVSMKTTDAEHLLDALTSAIGEPTAYAEARHAILSALTLPPQGVREAALEEAAKIADELGVAHTAAAVVASRIRALKATEAER